MASGFSFDATATSSSSLDGLPAFFSSSNVDDKKYESLLADLRAHDLLGPLDSDAGDAFGSSSSSLFFNDAFSAAFMGSFSENASSNAQAPAAASKPPPGFARTSPQPPPGLAATDTDLQWARGQQEFSRLEGQFHTGVTGASGTSAAVADDADVAFDETAFLDLRALGLDDDDTASGSSKRTASSPLRSAAPTLQQPAPPLPSSLPPPAGFGTSGMNHQHQQQQQQQPPPLPNSSSNSAAPPLPPGPWHQQQHQQHQQQQHHHQQQQQQQPPLPPHAFNGPPHMAPPPMPHMYMRGPHHPPPPHAMGYPPPPPHMPPFGPGGPHHHMPPHMPHMPPHMSHMHMPPPPPTGYKMMTPRDITFVVQQQLKQIRSSDPFSDDYYYHNYNQKRMRAVAGVGVGIGARPPALPLPSWKLEHVKSVDPRDAQREAGSRNWEASYHVLGRNSKGSLYRPKQLVALGTTGEQTVVTPSPATDGSDADSPTTDGVAETAVATADAAPKVLKMDAATTSVFANDTWQQRVAIDRGLQCLLSLQDARHILDARGINVQQFHALDAAAIDPSLAALRDRTTALLLELATLLGVVAPADGTVNNRTSDEKSDVEATGAHTGSFWTTAPMTCNRAQLDTMLSSAKGKKLVARALPLLHPSARFVLLPPLVEHLLAARNVLRISNAEADDDSDDRLCQTLVLILMYQPLAPPAALFAESLERAIVGHDTHTLARVLHNRARAEALQALLQRGGAAVEHIESAAVKQQWEHFQTQFVALATAIKQHA